MLREACKKKSLNSHDFVLINDTTGTLLCGVINRTGTNACYIEKISDVKSIKGQTNYESVIINAELGSFGEHHELDPYSTEFDSLVDKQSINSGQQTFEKMISGMNLGENVLIVIIRASDRGILFIRGTPKEMKEKSSFLTSIMSNVYFKAVFIQNFQA
ncbi:Hexokinase-1 [Thelohanellus kitauei]|uniref:Phosphotransferase n=1 Tax=Thelohanellus kitauei TaxID=669202 RepID=A0A0C2I982_THEKT|nr:Hexokinase-1 [Thelohanellus kitauei]